MPNQTMPNQTPADNLQPHIGVIMRGNRRVGGAGATGLIGLASIR